MPLPPPLPRRRRFRWAWLAAGACVLGVIAPRSAAAGDVASPRLPDDVLPVIGCWFWLESEFAPNGYRPYVDLVAEHATYNLLTTTLRVAQRELTDNDVHAQIKAAAGYARQRGIGMVVDLDVRLARAAFQRAYPDELQEMLRLREVELTDSGEVTSSIEPETLTDHYTHRATPYVPLAGRLVRVYAYTRGPQGIEPDTVEDITARRCKVQEASAKQVAVTIACDAQTKGRQACVLAAFAHFTPDVFAPHLLEFQRALITGYRDCPLRGVCKDEWGFPPCYDGCPAKNDFWYSRFLEAAYAQRAGGRDFLRDCLLMYRGERGREAERQTAINHLMEMTWQRNAAIEDDFYRTTKATFGPQAVVATHPTWWPNPDLREFKKNGLDWWAATRDWAQTDEVTPFCVRTALAKKWGSPVWYNMFYATKLEAYERGIWSHALGGGRMNFHPLFPFAGPRGASQAVLLRGSLTRGDSRIRLLNFISRSPLDCPVAVVFGHACAMNWAGPAYDDVGLSVANALWAAGFPADLIPTSQGLVVDPAGYVRYGTQPYTAVVLYHPEFERPETAAFFQRAAQGKTALYRVGDWTRNFEGQPLDGNAALPPAMQAVTDVPQCVAQVAARLRAAGVAPQTPADGSIGWDRASAAPRAAGRCRLLDGTEIQLAGEQAVAGDPLVASWEVKGHRVEFDAFGVAAVRLADDGRLEAMAAGGLKSFRAGAQELELDRRVDVALWRDAQGNYRGVVQDWDGPLPAALTALTPNWLRLAVPSPLGAEDVAQ
jgi:hypothetical protein